MCKAQGRRCPSSTRQRTQEEKDARNARRRAAYAARKTAERQEADKRPTSPPSGKRVLSTVLGDIEVDPTILDRNAREAYLNGQCFSLAVCLAERLEGGTRVGVLVRDSEIPWGTEYHDPEHLLDIDHDWFRDAIHALAVSPDGDEMLDIDGFRDADILQEETIDIHQGTLILMDPEDLRAAIAKDPAAQHQDYGTARIMAETLLKEETDIRCETCGRYADDAHECPSVTRETFTDFLQSPDMEEYAGMWDSHDNGASFSGLCEAINGTFTSHLCRQGVDAYTQDFKATDNGEAPKGFPHTVTVADGHVYDFTYRQINPDADVPTIIPIDEWNEQWEPLGYPYRQDEDVEALNMADVTVSESSEDYRMQHTAPDREYGAQASDMIASGIFPDDFYTHPQHYTSGFPEADNETLSVLRSVRGNPDAVVTVYRAAPAGVQINPGDWVTLSRAYAEQHAAMDDDPANDLPIYERQVRASDLYCAGDINEFGWDPDE